MIISRDFGLDLVALEMSQVARGDSGVVACVIRSSCGLGSLSLCNLKLLWWKVLQRLAPLSSSSFIKINKMEKIRIAS